MGNTETGYWTRSTEDINRALIEAAGITPDQVIQALGSGRSDLFGWRKLDTLQW